MKQFSLVEFSDEYGLVSVKHMDTMKEMLELSLKRLSDNYSWAIEELLEEASSDLIGKDGLMSYIKDELAEKDLVDLYTDNATLRVEVGEHPRLNIFVYENRWFVSHENLSEEG